MTDLIACLGAGKGTWTGVLKMASKQEFQNVYLIVSDWTKNSLQVKRDNLHLVIVNPDDQASSIRDSICTQLNGKIKDFEVAINIESGTGKEHTALIAALMKLGLSFRLLVLNDEKIEEVTFSHSVDLGHDA